MNQPLPVAVWRLRDSIERRRLANGDDVLIGMLLWSPPAGPQLIEVHRQHGARDALVSAPVAATRGAAHTFAETFPDGEAHAWLGRLDATVDAAATELQEVFKRPTDRSQYQWVPQKAAAAVVNAAATEKVAPKAPAESEAAAPIQLHGRREYWPRPLAESTDVEVLRAARGQLGTRIKGRPGNGKTMLVEAAFGSDLVVVQGHGDLTKDDLVGRYLPGDGPGGFEWHDGPLLHAMKTGRVLLVDEVTRAPSDTVNALLSATDDRRMLVLDERPDLPVVHASEGFHVVVTYNEFGVGVRPLDAAVTRRFPLEIEATTDTALLDRLGVHERLLTVHRRLERLDQHNRGNGGPGVWTPQTGHLLQAQKSLDLLGPTVAAGVLVAACTEPQDRIAVSDVVGDVFGIGDPVLTQGAVS